MPGRKAKPPRLWLRERKGRDPVWVVLHLGNEISTECGADDHAGAANFLAAYIGRQRTSTVGSHSPAELAIADVLIFYVKAKDPGDGADLGTASRYRELIGYVSKLLEFWGEKFVSAIKGGSCRDYVTWRTSQSLKAARSAEARQKRVTVATARRDLEVLRAAVNLYHAEYTLTAVPKITLPEKSVPRDRWLTRVEAARLLAASLGFVWDPAARRWRVDDEGRLVRRDRLTRTRRAHVRRFILIGLYTGTRHEAIERLQWLPNVSGGWFDLERGRIYRKARGERETKKRRPPAKIAHRLLPHLHRWQRLDSEKSAKRSERAGRPDPILHVVHRESGAGLSGPLRTAWAGCVADAGLDDEVIPHVLRHTAATWAMQAGTDPWEAAGMFGMTIETLNNTYGHHHPDFQEGAAGAFSGRK